MSDSMASTIHVGALVALLVEALERDETWHLASNGLRNDLRSLGARVEADLEDRSGHRRLHLVTG